MSSLVRALLATASVVTVLAIGGCPGPAYPKCESDDHCKKNQDGATIEEFCLFGQCQECAKDSHCGAGATCNQGRCEKSCDVDNQCGGGNICEESRCVPAQCKSDDACGAAGSCQAGRCLRKDAPQVTNNGGTSGNTSDGAVCEKRSNRVQFDFNASDLRPDGRAVLDNLAKCMSKNGDWRLTVEGHCDERGTPEYNLSLGEQRAKSVKKYLTALGVDDKRIRVVTYGEEKPLDSSSSEDAWAKNRRGELVVN